LGSFHHHFEGGAVFSQVAKNGRERYQYELVVPVREASCLLKTAASCLRLSKVSMRLRQLDQAKSGRPKRSGLL